MEEKWFTSKQPIKNETYRTESVQINPDEEDRKTAHMLSSCSLMGPHDNLNQSGSKKFISNTARLFSHAASLPGRGLRGWTWQAEGVQASPAEACTWFGLNTLLRLVTQCLFTDSVLKVNMINFQGKSDLDHVVSGSVASVGQVVVQTGEESRQSGTCSRSLSAGLSQH